VIIGPQRRGNLYDSIPSNDIAEQHLICGTTAWQPDALLCFDA
jgi:hypothetical protein